RRGNEQSSLDPWSTRERERRHLERRDDEEEIPSAPAPFLVLHDRRPHAGDALDRPVSIEPRVHCEYRRQRAGEQQRRRRRAGERGPARERDPTEQDADREQPDREVHDLRVPRGEVGHAEKYRITSIPASPRPATPGPPS